MSLSVLSFRASAAAVVAVFVVVWCRSRSCFGQIVDVVDDFGVVVLLLGVYDVDPVVDALQFSVFLLLSLEQVV